MTNAHRLERILKDWEGDGVRDSDIAWLVNMAFAAESGANGPIVTVTKIRGAKRKKRARPAEAPVEINPAAIPGPRAA